MQRLKLATKLLGYRKHCSVSHVSKMPAMCLNAGLYNALRLTFNDHKYIKDNQYHRDNQPLRKGFLFF
jgi:hypothetical protein